MHCKSFVIFVLCGFWQRFCPTHLSRFMDGDYPNWLFPLEMFSTVNAKSNFWQTNWIRKKYFSYHKFTNYYHVFLTNKMRILANMKQRKNKRRNEKKVYYYWYLNRWTVSIAINNLVCNLHWHLTNKNYEKKTIEWNLFRNSTRIFQPFIRRQKAAIIVDEYQIKAPIKSSFAWNINEVTMPFPENIAFRKRDFLLL